MPIHCPNCLNCLNYHNCVNQLPQLSPDYCHKDGYQFSYKLNSLGGNISCVSSAWAVVDATNLTVPSSACDKEPTCVAFSVFSEPPSYCLKNAIQPVLEPFSPGRDTYACSGTYIKGESSCKQAARPEYR